MAILMVDLALRIRQMVAMWVSAPLAARDAAGQAEVA